MSFAINGPNWAELQPGRDFVEANGTVSSYGTVMNWSAQQRSAKGIKAIVDDAIPSGKVQTGSTLVDDNGTPRRQWTLTDAAPPAVPEEISDRQFAYALAIKGRLTFDEAEEWSAVGALPQVVLDALALVPETDNLRAIVRGKLRSATAYRRSDSATVLMAQLMGETPQFMDEVWTLGATL